jgi:hypothetical protein
MKKPLIWGYGVTTVPERRTTLLRRTLASLEGAGYPEPHLFVDGLPCEGDCLDWGGFPRTFHTTPVRVAGNWILSAWELYLRNPACDRYAIFQDDIVVCGNLRAYLDQCEYPHSGYWNLCTYPKNLMLTGGKQGWCYSDQMGKGAQGLVFDNETFRALLNSPQLIERARRGRLAHKSVDGTISLAMRQANIKEYCHNPSLIFHTGEVSSQKNDKQPVIESFPGEEYDALRFLQRSETCDA